MRGAQRERLDQRGEAARVVRQPEARGQIRGAPCPRLVPGDDRELVGERGELRPPHPAVLGGAVHEHERRPSADPRIGDLEPVRPDDIHALSLGRARLHPQFGWTTQM